MDAIAEMVRNVVLIVLLASFIEMLLPQQELGKYVRMVMGLFVVIAILNPLVSWWKGKELNLEIDAWSFVPEQSETDMLLERGKEIQKQNNQLVMEAYMERMENQVEAMVKLLPEVTEVNADLMLERSEQNWGAVKNLEIVVKTTEKNAIKENESGMLAENATGELYIQKNDEAFQSTRELKQKISGLIQDFYSLSEKQVRVFVDGE